MADPAPTLDQRIIACLTTRLPAADAAEILTAATIRRRRIEEKMADVERTAISPTEPVSRVRAARDKLDDLRFDRRRAQEACEKLEARVQELRAAEATTARKDAMAALVAERDALAAEVAAKLPGMLDGLVDLIRRVHDLDARLPAGVISAEVKGRGYPPGGHWRGGEPVMRITSLRLPNFNEPGRAWPPMGLMG